MNRKQHYRDRESGNDSFYAQPSKMEHFSASEIDSKWNIAKLVAFMQNTSDDN